MNTLCALGVLILIGAMCETSALASRPLADLNRELRQFGNSPREFLNRLPRHWDQWGNPVSQSESPFFSSELIKSHDYVQIKNGQIKKGSRDSRRRRLHGLMRAPIAAEDDPEGFVDHFEVNRLQAMEERHLQAGAVDIAPWSDSYWPIAQGILANRYLDPKFPGLFDWLANSNFILSRLDQLDAIEIASPAEKYDLLVGDKNHTLTRRMLEEGKSYYEEFGKVESWMGICHGWAPASYMEKRPAKWVKILAADGVTEIPFYPSDIKALSSLIWANGRYSDRRMGRRCDVKNPKTDENGRVIEAECFDDNPAAWHIAVVNQIGISHRPFIMDATFDYQVWNQPVTKYEYRYFNPKTLETVASLDAATVKLTEFAEDKFKKYRSSEARSLAGVAMEVTYVLETWPSNRVQDGPEFDSLRTVLYYYDLELDGEGEIVGGEWYTNFHPDFLWGPTKDAKVWNLWDAMVDQVHPTLVWSSGKAVPEEWQAFAHASSQNAMPLSHVVGQLIEWAQ